jgi:DNA polymerase-3 subunit delta'
VDALSHPDLQLVCKPPDKSFVPIELFIGDREHRMREGLCHNIALKPFRGGRKVAVIDDADFLNAEGANCLLKTLEEPPPRSVLILIGTSEQKQLPTIRSRSQVIRFQALPEETVASLLVAQGLVADPAQARRLAALSGGSLTVAADLAEEQLGEFRQTLLRELAQPNGSAQDFPRSVIEFVEDAGKENAPRRARMVQVVGFAAEFYRQLMRSLSGAGVSGDEPLRGAVQSAHRSWAGDAETAAACLDRCVDAFGHIQANASPSALLESWLDELATITRRGRPL